MSDFYILFSALCRALKMSWQRAPNFIGDIMHTDNLHYNIEPLLTRNALINFVLSNRGPGKTFAFKDYAISDFLKTGKQFMYVRRYQTELMNISTFFNDIASFYPEHSFLVSGGKKGGKFLIDKEVAGYYAPLASQVALKSVPFPEVNKMCVDEFIIDKSNYHYLPNEVHSFFDLVETINRFRDTAKLHDLLRVFLFANTISMVNPYFDYFKLAVNPDKRFNVYKEYNNDIIVEMYKGDSFTEAKSLSRMGSIMNKTPYGQYAIMGQFYQDNDEFIQKRPSDSKCIIAIKYMDTTVYFYMKGMYIYASYVPYKNAPWKFSLTAEDHEPKYYLIKSANACGQTNVIIEFFKMGRMYFDNQSVKQQVFKIFQCLGLRRN
jgi:hypothetical protein